MVPRERLVRNPFEANPIELCRKWSRRPFYSIPRSSVSPLSAILMILVRSRVSQIFRKRRTTTPPWHCE
ncbi:MAG: hypothetical protein ACFFEY_17695 [Candidatus Thorarchaeota archaeon]